jgi:hypothetical protein
MYLITHVFFFIENKDKPFLLKLQRRKRFSVKLKFYLIMILTQKISSAVMTPF